MCLNLFDGGLDGNGNDCYAVVWLNSLSFPLRSHPPSLSPDDDCVDGGNKSAVLTLSLSLPPSLPPSLTFDELNLMIDVLASLIKCPNPNLVGLWFLPLPLPSFLYLDSPVIYWWTVKVRLCNSLSYLLGSLLSGCMVLMHV